MRPTPGEICSIYDGVDELSLQVDLQGWNSTGILFEEVIRRVQPEVIIEVGSWKGASAVHMARLAPKAIIYAVDVFINPIGVGLGEFPRTQIPPRWNEPDFYSQFLYNVKASGCHDRIIPVRGLTVPIASCLGAWGVQADMIYLDASHDELSVAQDLAAYWPLLRPGGILCGDDYSSHPGVKRAVQKFARGRTINEWQAAEGTQWSYDPK